MSDLHEFLRPDPGIELGVIQPIGCYAGPRWESSNRETWKAILRKDPCSYCGQRAGTVDHITPRSALRSLGLKALWLNYTGACEACNELKETKSLLRFLLDQKRQIALGLIGFTPVPIKTPRATRMAEGMTQKSSNPNE